MSDGDLVRFLRMKDIARRRLALRADTPDLAVRPGEIRLWQAIFPDAFKGQIEVGTQQDGNREEDEG